VQVGQIDDLALVHGAVPKAAFVRALIENHRVLHVITRVRDDGDNRVGTVRERVHSVGAVQRRANNGGLAGLEAVEFVVGAVAQSGRWCTHGLLTHLALVDITRAL